MGNIGDIMTIKKLTVLYQPVNEIAYAVARQQAIDLIERIGDPDKLLPKATRENPIILPNGAKIWIEHITKSIERRYKIQKVIRSDI